MIVRKRRTREHIIADLSVNFVEKQALLRGYTAERVRADYGYDLLLSTYDANSEIESGEVRIQVKATDALPTLKDHTTISYKVSRADLARWLHDFLPVILVVYNAEMDAAYWVYIQRYFEQMENFNLFSAPKTISVHVPTSNLLNPAAMATFSRYREDAIRQMPKGIHTDASGQEI